MFICLPRSHSTLSHSTLGVAEETRAAESDHPENYHDKPGHEDADVSGLASSQGDPWEELFGAEGDEEEDGGHPDDSDDDDKDAAALGEALAYKAAARGAASSKPSGTEAPAARCAKAAKSAPSSSSSTLRCEVCLGLSSSEDHGAGCLRRSELHAKATLSRVCYRPQFGS
jgi:hypothetical protein